MQFLFEVCPRLSGSRIVQQLHLRPEQDERLNLRRVSEGSGLQIHARLLPHGLAVRCQRGGGIAAEEELIVPAPLSRRVLFKEVIAVERLVLCVAVDVVGHHRPRLVRVRQLELEHGLEQRRIRRVFHHALAFQSASTLRRRELLCLATGGRAVCPPLKAVRDADDLACLFVYLRQVHHVLLHVALQVVYVDQRFGGRIARSDDLHVLRVHADAGLVRQRDVTARFQQLVDDLALDAVGGVLLVSDLVNIAVSQEPAVHAHVLLQDDREDVWLVERHLRRLLDDLHHRQPQLVRLRVGCRLSAHHAADGAAVASGDGHRDFLELFLGLLPLASAAVRAFFPPAPQRQRPRLSCKRIRRRVKVHLRRRAHAVRQQDVRRVHLRLRQQRLHRATLHAPAQPPRLIVFKVFQLRVVHPAVKTDAALVVAVVGDVLRHKVVRRGVPTGALDVRLFLALV